MESVLAQLNTASRKHFVNPYGEVEWVDSLSADAWLMSPDLLSLQGTKAFAQLTEADRQRLSLYEAANFFALNIHGERFFIGKLTQYMYQRDDNALNEYLHHFLDEENKHMSWFAEFCIRYTGKVYPDEHLRFTREYATGEEEFVFFASVVVFESITDWFNVKMAKDERLHALARRINLLHHRDEARHLVFGRELVQRLYAEYAPGWDPVVIERVCEHLRGFERATWLEYFNPDVYKDAGVPCVPYAIQQEALATPEAAARFAAATASEREFLEALGLSLVSAAV